MQGEGIDMSTMRKRRHFMEVSQHFCPSLWTIYKWTYKLTRAATLVKWKPLLKVMFESPLSVILSTVHHFYSLYHKVPASNTSIQITIKQLHLHAYMLQSYFTSYKTKNINIYIPYDNHTETVLRFRTQHGLHSSLRICYEWKNTDKRKPLLPPY